MYIGIHRTVSSRGVLGNLFSDEASMPDSRSKCVLQLRHRAKIIACLS